MPGTPRALRTTTETCCSACQQWLPSTMEFFSPRKDCRDGLIGQCRTCYNAKQRDWKRRNHERVARMRRERYAETKGAEHKRREIIRALAKPIRFRAQVLRSGMRERARELSVPWDAEALTVDYLIMWMRRQPACDCCGRGLDIGRKFNGVRNDASPSIDRLVPELGYVLGNVALLCWRCNCLKRDASPEELERVATWMRSRGLSEDSTARAA